MSDEVRLSVSLPLDGDGFLRRECPTCEREFKSPDPEADEDGVVGSAEAAEVPEGYSCPYCAITAPTDAWLTKAQVAVMEEIVQRELIEPELGKLARQVDRLNRRSGGLIGIEVRVERDEPEPAPELDEADDMRRVDFPATRPSRSRCSTTGTGRCTAWSAARRRSPSLTRGAFWQFGDEHR